MVVVLTVALLSGCVHCNAVPKQRASLSPDQESTVQADFERKYRAWREHCDSIFGASHARPYIECHQFESLKKMPVSVLPYTPT